MNTPWLPSQQRKYAETDLRELERLLAAAPGPWFRLFDDPDESIHERNTQAAARALVANLRARLPKLLALWDAAKEARSCVSISPELACNATYGFVDKEPWDAFCAALEELDEPLHKKKEMS